MNLICATLCVWFGFRINIKYTQCNERIYANNCFWPRDRLQAATAATFKLQQLQHLQGALGKQRRENDGAGQVAGNRPVVNSDLMAMAEEDGGRGRRRQREREAATARSTVLNCPSAMHSHCSQQQILVHLPLLLLAMLERKWKWLRAVCVAFAAASRRDGYVYVLRMLLRGFNRLMAAAAAATAASLLHATTTTRGQPSAL